MACSEESKDDRYREEGTLLGLLTPWTAPAAEFIARNGEFSIHQELAIGGKPVLGVVMQPATGLLYAGAQGLGAPICLRMASVCPSP